MRGLSHALGEKKGLVKPEASVDPAWGLIQPGDGRRAAEDGSIAQLSPSPPSSLPVPAQLLQQRTSRSANVGHRILPHPPLPVPPVTPAMPKVGVRRIQCFGHVIPLIFQV